MLGPSARSTEETDVADDIAELREIFASDDDATPADTESDAPQPLDGAPGDEAAAEPEEESEELSAEDRVAALLAEGTEPEAAEDEEPDGALEAEATDETSDDEDMEALLEEGRRARAERAQQEAVAPYAEVYQSAEQRVIAAKQHYAQERRRIVAAVHADAEQAVDRDAYLAQHLDAAIDGVIGAEEAWIARIGADARMQVQQIREQQARPAWAAHLAAERHLPKEAIPRILTVSDPRQMPAIADMLVEARNALATERRKRTRAEREREARLIASNQVHPGATGRPAGAKPIELTGGLDELRAILKIPNA